MFRHPIPGHHGSRGYPVPPSRRTHEPPGQQTGPGRLNPPPAAAARAPRSIPRSGAAAGLTRYPRTLPAGVRYRGAGQPNLTFPGCGGTGDCGTGRKPSRTGRRAEARIMGLPGPAAARGKP
jgi:hypothetical protein